MSLQAISLCILSLIYFWTLYNAAIVAVGIRKRMSKNSEGQGTNRDELPTVSIIVPVKNEEGVIMRLLKALSRLDYPESKKEIIIVEDGSRDRTGELCREYAEGKPNVKFFHRNASKGKPNALNFGLVHAKGEIVSVFDADSVPEPDVLLRAANYFKDPSIVAVQGLTRSLNSEEGMLTKIASLEEAAWFQALLRGRDDLGLFIPLTGSCLFVRRRVLEELGGWDEHSLTEDVEMAVRLAEKGYLVRYASDMKSWQETPYNLTQLVRQRTRWFRGYMETALKYGRLLKSPSKLSLDTEITLIGPYILVLCLLSYIVTSLTFLTRAEADLVSDILVCLTNGLMGITLLMIGTTLAYMTKPRKMRNLLWIPFIYGYWALQNLIAARALLHIILRRPRIWTRTVKRGTVTSPNLSIEDTPRAEVNLNLRVCFISSYPPNRARLSEYAQSLLKELGNRPGINRIYVLADMVGDSKNRAWISPKVEVLRVWKADHPFSILGVIPCILKLRSDVVHFNIHFQSYGRSRITNFMGLSLPFLCRVLGVPSVVSIHNLGERVNLKALDIEASFFNRLGIRLATRLVTLAKAVTVTVRSYVGFLERRYQCRNVTFVPHGTAVFDPPNLAPVNPHKTILMFGHMSPYKGLPLMFEVFNRLIKERGDLRLIIAGNSHPNFPDYLDKFRENPPPNVEFTGYLDEARLPELFQNAFMVVLPYLTGTGTSGVFHLACGFGKPIVASDLPEIRELVMEGASALLVPPNDIEGFCKAIVRLCDEPELVEEMGKRNLSFASRESWSAAASSFEQIYSELVSKRNWPRQ